MSESITLTVVPVKHGGRVILRATAYGIQGGRYGSIASLALDPGVTEMPRDPEDLVALLLQAVVGVCYSS